MIGGAAQAPRFEPAVSATEGAGVVTPGRTSAEGAAYESELTWLSTRQLAAQIASGRLSAREALADHLARLDAVNPTLNAVVTRDDERAFEQAAAADSAFSRGDRLTPLHGVPMTHKDTHDTAGMRTTYGSPILADNVPIRDALVIGRLRAAGVVTTGKSNVPEFAAGSHTFNPIFGTTVNPYDTTKSAAGSSGGAAAAIAAGVQASGDGSDMGGSLRLPASFNNIVGMRPTNGRIPHTLPSNPWSWLAQSGFMARSVSDVALLMATACGPADGAPLSVQEPGSVFDRLEFRWPGEHRPGSGLRGLRIGFSTDLGGMLRVDPSVAEVVDRTADSLTIGGGHVDGMVPDLRDADEVFRVTRAYEFAARYGETVRRHGDQVKESVVWNTEMGLNLTVDELVSADAARARLAGSGRDVLRAPRPARPHDEFGGAVRRGPRVPRDDRRQAHGGLPRMDACGDGHLCDRMPCRVRARGLHARRPAGGSAAGRRTREGRGAAAGRPGVRGAHRPRRAEACAVGGVV